MKIFVSSRMTPKERKCAIEAVHLARHRVLFIEAEEHYRDAGVLRRRMTTMIEDAHAFVGVYTGDLGSPVAELGDKEPVVFELDQMLRSAKSRGLEDWQRILLFCQEGHDHAWIDEMLEIHKLSAYIKKRMYTNWEQLITAVYDQVEPFDTDDRSVGKSGFAIDIEYHGQDRAGLLQKVSERLFSVYGMNIDNVWAHTDSNKQAFLFLAASWIGGVAAPTAAKIEDELRNELIDFLPGIVDKDEVPIKVRGPSKEESNENESTNGSEPDRRAYGHIEIRCIDAPGQLNAVCKGLKSLDLNISHIHLAQAPVEFERQTVISLEIPLDKKGEEMSRRAKFLLLESKLRDLVGVRAIATRLSHPDTDIKGVL